MIRLIAAVCAVVCAVPLYAGPKVITPAPGSQLRSAILAPVRTDARHLLGIAIRWKVGRLRVCDDWAFFMGDPVDSKGKPIDFVRTKLKAEFLESRETGVWESGFAYLLKKKGRAWAIVEREVAGMRGDTQIGEWMNRYKSAAPVFAY